MVCSGSVSWEKPLTRKRTPDEVRAAVKRVNELMAQGYSQTDALCAIKLGGSTYNRYKDRVLSSEVTRFVTSNGGAAEIRAALDAFDEATQQVRAVGLNPRQLL